MHVPSRSRTQIHSKHVDDFPTERQLIPDRKLVNRMIPDDVMPVGEDSGPCWSFGIHLLLL